VASADVVLTDSNTLACTLRQAVPDTTTRIIRFGVEVHDLPGPAARSKWRRQLEIKDDTFALLSSRLIRPLYNIDRIIRALAVVRRRIPNSVLILKEFESLSDPDYREYCFGLVRELGLRDAVRIVGELNREELLELQTAADLYVSIPNSDGTSVSVLEAMAAGVAIVASDVPGIDPAILRDDVTALLVAAADAESLASAVIALGVDPHRRRALAERARAVVRVHGNFDRELDRCVLLYEELVRGRGRGR
jgi:glycosyltransferase involved in cell wall biosynthesis